jgi:hypothetical protein
MIDRAILDARRFACEELRTIYKDYRDQLLSQYTPTCSFASSVTLHLDSMSKLKRIPNFLEGIAARQAIIAEDVILETPIASVEELFTSFPVWFPYDFVITDLLSKIAFFRPFFQIILKYTVPEHKNCLKSVFLLMNNRPSDPYVRLAIAEILLSVCVFDKIRPHFCDPVSDFSFSENCKILVRDGLSSIITSRDCLVDCPPEIAKIDAEPVQKVTSKPPYFSVDDPLLVPQIRHVVLELRKLATQTSVTMLNCVLAQAMAYLVAAIAPRGANVGADESFQFFVAALAEAQLFALPTILKIIENLIVQDLRPAKATFLASQLRIGLQFIQSRSISVPPCLLLPYIDRESEELVLENEEKVTLRCFAVFAKPFTKRKSAIPRAIVRCTGDPLNQAVVYKYRLVDGKEPIVGPYYHSLATTEGSVCYVESNDESFKTFIAIDEGGYEDRMADIRVISNLNAMLPPKDRAYRLASLRVMTAQFARMWKRDEAGDLGNEIIAEGVKVQEALKRMGRLPPDYDVTGVLDFPTLEAIVGIQRLRSIEAITPQVVADLCSSVNDRAG